MKPIKNKIMKAFEKNDWFKYENEDQTREYFSGMVGNKFLYENEDNSNTEIKLVEFIETGTFFELKFNNSYGNTLQPIRHGKKGCECFNLNTNLKIKAKLIKTLLGDVNFNTLLNYDKKLDKFCKVDVAEFIEEPIVKYFPSEVDIEFYCKDKGFDYIIPSKYYGLITVFN